MSSIVCILMRRAIMWLVEISDDTESRSIHHEERSNVSSGPTYSSQSTHPHVYFNFTDWINDFSFQLEISKLILLYMKNNSHKIKVINYQLC